MILFILVLSVYILWKTKRFVAARYNAVHFLYGKFYQKWWWTILDDLYLKVITSEWASYWTIGEEPIEHQASELN